MEIQEKTTVVAKHDLPVGEEAPINPEVTEEAPVEIQEVAKKEDSVKYSTYRRILDEKVKLKGKLAEIQAELETKTQKTLEEQNNFKALYESTKQKLGESEKKVSDLESIMTSSFTHGAVIDALEKNGLQCVDHGALFALGNDELLQYTEDEGVLGIEAFIDDAKNNFPYLFQTQNIPKTANMPPNFGKSEKPVTTAEDFDKLPREQQDLLLKQWVKQSQDTQGK